MDKRIFVEWEKTDSTGVPYIAKGFVIHEAPHSFAVEEAGQSSLISHFEIIDRSKAFSRISLWLN